MVKKILPLVFFLFVLTACGTGGEKQVENGLHEKYGENFTATYDKDGQYIAKSETHSEIPFMAYADNDGNFTGDEYEARQVEQKISETVGRSLAVDGSYVFSELMVRSVTDEEIKNERPDSENRVTINICMPDSTDKNGLIDRCNDAVRGVPELTGVLNAYVAPEKELKKMREYIETHPKKYADFDDAFEKYKECSYRYQYGTVNTATSFEVGASRSTIPMD